MEGYRSYSFICLIIISAIIYVRGQLSSNVCGNIQYIPCDNGECIRRYQWCDKSVNCQDESDEKYCKTDWTWWGSNHCTEKHVTCRNTKCMPTAVVCDGFDDCGDSSDEDLPECRNFRSTPASDETLSREDKAQPEVTQDSFRTPRPGISTSTSNFYTSGTSDDYYDRRRGESGYRNSITAAPPPPHPPTLFQGNNHYHNREHGTYSQPVGSRTTPKGSDTSPERHFPYDSYPITTPPTGPGRRQPSRPSYVHREQHMMIPPRVVLYAPISRPSYSHRRITKRTDFPQFFFNINNSAEFGYRYKQKINEAKDWLLGKRDDSYGWGRDTQRALIALSLITNTFTSDESDNELMKKNLQTHLGIKLLRNDSGTEIMSTTRLATYINALLATCQNPHNFLDLDLVEILHSRKSVLENKQIFVNPLIYLSLCLSNNAVNFEDLTNLTSFIKSTFSSEISKDLHILAMTALACIHQQIPSNRNVYTKLRDGIYYLLQEQKPDGSFGSLYTTALAAQALMSVNTSSSSQLAWNPTLTLNYIAERQLENGSFGDMQATYYSVIALSGRSLVYLRNTQCDAPPVHEKSPIEDIVNPPSGPLKTVFYTLRVGNPETSSIGMQLTVRADANFYEIMRVAAHNDPRFKFNFKITGDKLGVHTIYNVPNDPERGFFWNLYVLSPPQRLIFHERYIGSLNSLIPEDGQELLFWYMPIS